MPSNQHTALCLLLQLHASFTVDHCTGFCSFRCDDGSFPTFDYLFNLDPLVEDFYSCIEPGAQCPVATTWPVAVLAVGHVVLLQLVLHLLLDLDDLPGIDIDCN